MASLISGSGATTNTISGNYIGTDATGSLDLSNSQNGVVILDGAQNNVIGGSTSGERNVIAFSGLDGIEISDDTSTGNTITQNSIHSNTGLGIDLVNGGNADLAAPTVSAANACFVMGTAGAGYTVEVFTDPDDEGKTYLTTVSADGGGNWSAPGPFTLDNYVTATATDASSNTSEFSTKVTAGTCYQTFVPLIMKNY